MSGGFDSIEDAFAWMEQQEMAANERATEEQKAITYGDYWIRFVSLLGGMERLVIFGHVLPLDDMPEEDRGYVKATHDRGYRFSRCYSVAAPRGELGDVHVSQIAKIPKSLFDLARLAGWDIPFPR